MADACANCFFFRVAPVSAGPAAAGSTFCHGKLPYENVDERGYPWKPVQADWWCKHGSDTLTGRAFDQTSQPGTGSSSQGMFGTGAGAANATITDPSTGAVVILTSLNSAAANLQKQGIYLVVTKGVGFVATFAAPALGGELFSYASFN